MQGEIYEKRKAKNFSADYHSDSGAVRVLQYNSADSGRALQFHEF
jgi:hypothetical protein